MTTRDPSVEAILARHGEKGLSAGGLDLYFGMLADDEDAEAIAAERIRNGAADHKEDGAEALAKLGIRL